MSSAPGLPGLPPRCGLRERGAQRRRARGRRPGRRALPLLSRSRARHGDRQRQSSAAVGQPRRARLSARRSAPSDALAGPPAPISPSSISPAASAGRLRINAGRLPWWIFDPQPPRAGHQRARLSGIRAGCCGRPPATTICEVVTLRRAALRAAGAAAVRSPRSTPSRRRAAPRSPAAIMRETLAAGGKACRPLIARDGLRPRLHRAGAALSRRAQRHGAISVTGCARCDFAGDQVAALDFGDDAGRARRPAMR